MKKQESKTPEQAAAYQHAEAQLREPDSNGWAPMGIGTFVLCCVSVVGIPFAIADVLQGFSRREQYDNDRRNGGY